jgi:hypothetical protein
MCSATLAIRIVNMRSATKAMIVGFSDLEGIGTEDEIERESFVTDSYRAG